MTASARATVESLLARIQDLTRTLENSRDQTTRRTARELLEATLNLHGLALAKIASGLAASSEGCTLYSELGRDEQVKAVLLLHGLHPDSAEERIRDAIAQLDKRLGVSIRLRSVSDGIARVTVDAKAQDWTALCREIGGALIDAAPDLDDIAIDRAPIEEPALIAAAE